MRTAHVVVVMLLSVVVLLSVIPILPVRGTNAYPVPSFTYSPSYPQPHEQVIFNASASYDPDGYIASYNWTFGDGFNATLTTPIVGHTYINDGTYQVTLLVTDNQGANSLTSKTIVVNSHVWFRLTDSSGTPISNVTVTVYYSNDSASSHNWYVAPAGPDGMEIQYDLITQPNLSNSGNKYRNPGYTASILRDTSNIGFEIHPSDWYVFFKFQWGSNVLYWPNETSRVFSYNYGTIDTHYYKTTHQAIWNSYAGTYVIKSSYITSDGVNPKSYYPIFMGYETVPALTVSINPSSTTLDVGQSQTFSSTVLGGTAPYSYQWYLNGAAVAGATASFWIFTPSSAGSYTVYLNVTDNTSTRVKSNTATITVNAALSVSISPGSATLDVGQSQLFTSSVSGGTSPLSYQWYLNGAAVSGATSSSWTFTPSSAGTYNVYLNVTDNVGVRVKSNTATVAVQAAPSVSIAPASATLDVGQSQLFTSSLSGGTTPFSYQWYLNGAPVSGATSSSWTFTPASAGSYNVYLRVTDALSMVATSNTAIVTVNGALSASITPTSSTLDIGQSRLFTSSVSGGTSPFSYQWYLNGIAVSGATSSTWTFSPSSVGSFTVYVNITDSLGMRVKSNVAAVTVNAAPSVSISPTSVTMDVGQSQTFTSTISGGTGPFSYQWYLNGSPVSGATSSSWTFTPSSSEAYTVYLRITDSLGVQATSNTVPVAVNGALSVAISPSMVTMDIGQSQLFISAVSGGTAPFSYQWYLNGAPVSGATSSSWTFAPVSTGLYSVSVRVTDNVGASDDSNIASVTVNAQLGVTISPTSASIYLGQYQSFISAVSGGTGPFSYQWYLNGNPVSGVTASSWTFTPTLTGIYQVYVRVTDSVGAVIQSGNAQLTVNPPPSLSVTISPGSAVIDLTQSVSFTSSISGGTGPFSYQWYLNSVSVSGATSASWLFSPSSTGNYQVSLVVTDSLSVQTNSNIAPVTVNPLPSVSISPASLTIDVGQSKTFTSSVLGGTPPFSYQWYLNGSPVSGATSSSWTFTPSSSGAYTVYLRVTDNVGKTAQSTTSSVTVNPELSASISPTSVVMDVGQSQLFTSTVSGGTSPFFYQWYLNSAPVSGATSSSWAFSPSSPGTYSVYVTVTDSADIDPTVQSPPTQTIVNPDPTISITPSSVTMDIGQSKLFTSTVSGGTSPFTYQWYLNGIAISGATGATWTFTPASTGSYNVYANVTDNVGVRAKSNIAAVTVNPALSISISPTSVTMDVGQSQTFTSSVSGGTSPFSYQWYLNGIAVTGATSSSWVFTPSSSGSYNIYVNVTDSVSFRAKSNIATATVNSALGITISPSSATLDVGQSRLFTSTVSGGTSPFSYQWYLDSVPVPGATSASWTFTPTSAGSYSIYLKTTDNVGMQATSNTAHVTVNGVPTVSISPASSTIHVGDTIGFTSTPAGGTTPYTYQWYLNGAAVSGATGSAWTFSEPMGSYMVYLNITDNMGIHVKSNVATVTVLATLTVSISPSGSSISLGDSVSFTSTVNGGTTPYYYQWYLNGAPVPGATLSSWTFTPTSTGTYSVFLNVTDGMSVKAKSNIAGVIVSSAAVGGISDAISANPLLSSWLSVVSLLAAAILLKGIIAKKKRN